MSKTLGDRVRLLREAKGWRQDELAQRVGLNREALSSIENNHRQIKAEELNRFADILEVSCDQLLGRIPLDEVNLANIYPIQKAKEAMRISVPANNVQKFREVLLYILNKVGAKSNVGETVIYKLLYFIDFDFYEKYEEQFVGATYKKNTFGPTPIEFAAIVDSMISEKEVERIKSAYYQKEQKKYLPLRKPNLDCLSGKEIALIDEVLNRLSDKNASQISEYSHGDIPWKVTGDMEVIDYETVFYRTPEYSVRNNGSGDTLTINASLPSLTWTVDTTTPINVNTTEGHISNGGAQIVYNLPAAAGVGDGFAFLDLGGNGFQLQCQGGQTVRLGNQVTSSGGTVTTTAIGDVIWLVCAVANTTFLGYSAQGNLTFA